MLSNTRTIGTQSYATAYHYDGAGCLNGVTYPTDTLLSYSLDALGRVQRISANREGVALRATLLIPARSVSACGRLRPLRGLRSALGSHRPFR